MNRRITEECNQHVATYVSATAQVSQTFDPYGNPYAQSVAPTTAPPSYGYTGEQVDANGLVYLRARYYSPSIGRFTQPDPFGGAISLPASLNPYGYTHGNPVRYADPSGEFPLLLALAIIGAGVLGTAAYGYEVNQNMQAGMDFWNAAYHQNIDWRIVGGAAAVGAVALPAAYGCLFMWAACAAGYMWLDYADDAATAWAAANGDPEAAAQIQMLNAMGLFNLPDLPVNFLASKWDDLAEAGKYADDIGDFFSRHADDAGIARLSDEYSDFLPTSIRNAPDIRMQQSLPSFDGPPEGLHPLEGLFGTHEKLYILNEVYGETHRLTPHHMPATSYMENYRGPLSFDPNPALYFPKYKHRYGAAFNVSVGIHDLTRTMRRGPVSMFETPEQALAGDIDNLRFIYQLRYQGHPNGIAILEYLNRQLDEYHSYALSLLPTFR